MEIFRAKVKVILSCTSKFTSEPGHILSTLWLKTLTEYSDKTHAYASCKTSLFFGAFRLTVIDFFGEFCELLLDTCIKKPYYGYNNDHTGLAGLRNRNRRSFGKSKE